MPKRSITDKEIGLIKAMLVQGLRNRDIQFYFNRQDRPVNSGRITQIRKGSYGPKVPPASETELDAFFATFAPVEVGVMVGTGRSVKAQSVAEIARERFEKRGDGRWYLRDGETARQECKGTFDPAKLNLIIKAIAALANNAGGFIFLGVSNSGCRVEGLDNDAFLNMDIVRITDKAKTYLTPTPIFYKEQINLGRKKVGVIRVEKYPDPPIIVCKDGDGLEDGSILFRYPGQSSRIKYGDLLAMLRERDKRAQQHLLVAASKVSSVGTDNALILDTKSNTLDAGDKTIVIDKALSDQLKFIREGEFDETEGAPTLRLIGDVKAISDAEVERIHIVRENITTDAVLRNFLKAEPVEEPLQYLLHSVHSQRKWLPLFYYLHLSRITVEQAVERLKKENATYPSQQKIAVDRLLGVVSAFKLNVGKPRTLLDEFKSGTINFPSNEKEDNAFILAVQGLPDDFSNADSFRALLFTVLERAQDNTPQHRNRRSAIFHAACRIDEMLFAPKPTD